MKKLLIALCLVALAGCAQVKDAGDAVIDAIKAPPEAVHSAFSQIVTFAYSLFVEFFAHLFSSFTSHFGL